MPKKILPKIPPPWVIEEEERKKRRERPEERPELPLPLPPPSLPPPDSDAPEDPDKPRRGVEIIEPPTTNQKKKVKRLAEENDLFINKERQI